MKKNKRRNGASEEGVEPVEAKPAQQYAVPEGYEDRTSDIVGFWNFELGPIHFIPQYAKAFDSHIESNKPAIIVVGHAIGPQRVMQLDASGEEHEIECKSGDVIGVWYKPGMAQLKDLAGCKVFMQYTGEQDTGKPNPMKTFRLSTPPKVKGGILFLQDDYRKKSKHAAIPFELKNGPRPSRAGDDDEDFGDRGRDIPY